MSEANVEQKTYHMPPKDGFTVAHFLTVADVERSLRFYEKVFGGRIVSGGDSKGAPGYLQIAHTWLIVSPDARTWPVIWLVNPSSVMAGSAGMTVSRAKTCR